MDTLSDVEDSRDDALQRPEEVAAYIDHKTPKDTSFHALSLWGERSFPNISQIARFILVVPASSAASERAFSSAGYVVQEQRSLLKPSAVDDVLFVHGNLNHHAKHQIS